MTAPERPAGRPTCGARPAGAQTDDAVVDDREQLVEPLVTIAMQLVGCVRDYGPAEVQAVLDRVPGGRHDALAVVLAAMVDPDARPSQLLAWLDDGPVQSRGMDQPSRRPLRSVGRAFDDVAVERAMAGHRVRLRPAERAEAVRRLTTAGRSAAEIAAVLGTTKRSVTRVRSAHSSRRSA